MMRNRAMVIAALALGPTFAQNAAHAATLSMRFAGGGHEITLAPGESAVVEVTILMGNLDKAKHKVSRIDSRFDVGHLVPGASPPFPEPGYRPEYVQDGPSPLSVIDVVAPNYPSWTAEGSAGVGGPFNSGFLLSVGDPSGVFGVPIGIDGIFPILIATFHIRLDVSVSDTLYAVFRVNEELPTLHNGTSRWNNRFGSDTLIAGQQFEIGQGNPGDADPRWDPYHGYEALQPLIIHAVPEPGALALFAFLSLAVLRQQSGPTRGRAAPEGY